jgi:hypothetical protein
VKRDEVFAAFERADVTVDEGMKLRTDDAAERLFHAWHARGAPSRVTVGIDSDASGEERFWIEPYASGDLFADPSFT